MPESIPILIDDTAPVPVSLGMFSGGVAADVVAAAPRLVEVSLDTVQQGIRSVLEKAARAVGESQLSGTDWHVSEVKVSLSIDGNGQVSLLSVVRGQITARATLDVTLRLAE